MLSIIDIEPIEIALKEGKMLNYHVFCPTRSRTLVPWRIEALESPNVTFREFLSSKFDLDGLELDKSFVGRSKENLDPVAPDLVAANVIQTFGPFAKYHVKELTSTSRVTQGRLMLCSWPHTACLIVIRIQ